MNDPIKNAKQEESELKQTALILLGLLMLGLLCSIPFLGSL